MYGMACVMPGMCYVLMYNTGMCYLSTYFYTEYVPYICFCMYLNIHDAYMYDACTHVFMLCVYVQSMYVVVY